MPVIHGEIVDFPGLDGETIGFINWENVEKARLIVYPSRYCSDRNLRKFHIYYVIPRCCFRPFPYHEKRYLEFITGLRLKGNFHDRTSQITQAINSR